MLAVLALVLIACCLLQAEGGRPAYRLLKSLAEDKSDKQPPRGAPLTQRRRGALKTFLSGGKDLQRKKVELESSAGTLAFNPTDTGLCVVEELESVILHHPFGTVKARSMSLIPEKAEGRLSLGHIVLRGEVSFAFNDGSALYGDYAEVDPLEGKGYLAATRPGARDRQVRFIKPKSLFTLYSDEVTASWKENASDLLCEGDVNLLWGEEIRGEGDVAHYCNDSGGAVVTLRRRDRQARCRLSHVNGDILEAELFAYYPETGIVYAEHPRGNVGDPPFAFESPQGLWRLHEGVFLLKGGTKLTEKTKGIEMTFSGDVVFELISQTLSSEGKATILQCIEGQGLVRQLSGQGFILLDLKEQRLTQHAAPGTKIEYMDEAVILSADRFDASFAKDGHGGAVVLRALTCCGGVRLTNRSLPHEGEPWQYLLAERLEYLPQNDSWLFSSPPPTRVSCYDRVNDMTITASQLQLIRDAASGKVSIRALGTTRFTLPEHSLEGVHKMVHGREST